MRFIKNNTTRFALGAVLCLLAINALASAATIPVESRLPDAKPPAKDKPVKVYVIPSQSKMADKCDVANFSTIAFAFANKLHQEIKVPIGILNCSFSQTSISPLTTLPSSAVSNN